MSPKSDIEMALIKTNGFQISSEESYLDEGNSFTKNKFQGYEIISDNSQTERPFRVPLDEQRRVFVRFCVFLFCVILIIIGRFNVPDNSPACVIDKVMDWLQGVNDWILKNPYWRDTMQIMCSLFMDAMFLSLGTYWIFKGKSSRLIVSVIIFYVTRAFVQSLWFSPYTKGFWWYDPGFPSIVVPYGRGSDFFFSGHIGFVTICASEWYAYGKKVMVYILTLGGLYTAFILIAYQVHYSIDIFTGAFFAHYVFIMVDNHKDKFDNAFLQIYWEGSILVRKMIGAEK
jgi:hypothetical protein